jgi:hypothetical protein
MAASSLGISFDRSMMVGGSSVEMEARRRDVWYELKVRERARGSVS